MKKITNFINILITKKTKHKKIKAFNLVEMSVVILIVGVLISGIAPGMDLYRDMFIKQNVKKLTVNSPVGGIPDLAAWYETTQQVFDGTLKDINPQSARKKNLTGRIYLDTSETFQRIFFTWNWAFANSELMPQSELVSSEGNTIFFVSTCAPRHGGVCGSAFGISKTPYCRWGDQGGYILTIDHMWNWFCYHIRGATGVHQSACGTYDVEKWRNKNKIMTFQNSASSIFIRIDGVEFAKNTSINASGMAIGGDPVQINIGCSGVDQWSGSYRDFQGRMSEIILYNRPLSMKEIKVVEDYLSRKYSVPITR